jgi:hypothetical protein
MRRFGRCFMPSILEISLAATSLQTTSELTKIFFQRKAN